MKPSIPSPRSRAFTIWDLLIVLVTVGLVVILLPMLARPKFYGNPIKCKDNLKQIWIAFLVSAGDNDERFPWVISTNQGGSKEYLETGEVFRHFLAVSNELNSPKILFCGSDTTRTNVANWGMPFGNQNLSYFVSLDVPVLETQPRTIMAGDRNITGGVMVSRNLMLLKTNGPASWGTNMHNGCGNLALGDGSVGQYTGSALQQQLLAATNAVIRLAIP